MPAFRPARPRSRPGWHVLLCLLALALLARGLVPAGFMPDARAARAGELQLSFCSGGGSEAALAASDDEPHEPGAASALECPFAVLAHQPSDVPAGALEATAPGWTPRAVTAPVGRSLPPLPALGPPLGSRAPPLSFA